MEFQIVAMLFQGICAQFLAIFPNFGQFDAIQFQAINFEAISCNLRQFRATFLLREVDL